MRALLLCLVATACATTAAPNARSGPAIFAGRPLALPAGCTAYPSGTTTTVRCSGDENLVWQKDAGDVAEEVFVDALTEELAHFGAISQRLKLCEVQGVAAQCHLFEASQQVSALYVGLQVRSDKLRLVCIHKHRAAEPALPVCSQLVQVK